MQCNAKPGGHQIGTYKILRKLKVVANIYFIDINMQMLNRSYIKLKFLYYVYKYGTLEIEKNLAKFKTLSINFLDPI
jgi:hypothetical protein